MSNFEVLLDTQWDVVIVGSGIGGSVTACSLAEQGYKVLILEKGSMTHPLGSLPIWKEAIQDHKTGYTGIPFLGECVGGSSRLFGMVMESLEPSDFINQGGGWPSSFQEWSTWAHLAERLFSVKEAPAVLEFNGLYKQMKSQGLETKPLRLAFQPDSNCQYCQSDLCKTSCKVDAWTGPLTRALRSGNAHLVTEIEVKSLIHRGGRVIRIECQKYPGGPTISISGKQFVLAAGALKTPLILKRSSSVNQQFAFEKLKATGSYFMRHLIDLYILCWPDWKSLSLTQKKMLSQIKAWGSDSLYQKNHFKLGTLQSFGSLPNFEYIWPDVKRNQPWIRYTPFLKPLARQVVEYIFQHPTAASIVEDSPNVMNRIEEGAHGELNLFYKMSEEDQIKIDYMRRLVSKALGPMLLRQEFSAENNFRLAHACGTCRMGTDLNTSVTNYFGQVHQSENLWIADSSVFPSSTGKNPSLIIASHALRLVQKMKDLGI